MFEDGFVPLSPINFFDISYKVMHLSKDDWKKEIENERYFLPRPSPLLGEPHPFKFHMAWSNEGLFFYLNMEEKFNEPNFPTLAEGDSLELFIDTRDVKNSRFITKFCHHFYFLPVDMDGHMKGEITRFRTEDAHELCPGEDLVLHSAVTRQSTKMKIMIPAACLFGYDPAEVTKLGFSYRINQRWEGSLHFSSKTQEFAIEQEPTLWSSFTLVN